MNEPVSLAELGPRICVLGPSNSGKSTLADAIARHQGYPVVHLDQLHHLPYTAWKPRPRESFHALHDQAIGGDSWVMEGNYSSCMPQRFARATGVILLDVSTFTSLHRYVRRTWFDRRRVGGLEGARERINGAMLHHIVFTTPANRRRYAALFERLSLPKVRLASSRDLEQVYTAWALSRPSTRV